MPQQHACVACTPEQQAAGAQVRVLGQRAATVLAQLHERAQILSRQRDGGRHGRLPHAQHLDAQRELRRGVSVREVQSDLPALQLHSTLGRQRGNAHHGAYDHMGTAQHQDAECRQAPRTQLPNMAVSRYIYKIRKLKALQN